MSMGFQNLRSPSGSIDEDDDYNSETHEMEKRELLRLLSTAQDSDRKSIIQTSLRNLNQQSSPDPITKKSLKYNPGTTDSLIGIERASMTFTKSPPIRYVSLLILRHVLTPIPNRCLLGRCQLQNSARAIWTPSRRSTKSPPAARSISVGGIPSRLS